MAPEAARAAPRRSALRVGGWVVAARVAPQASGLVLLVLGGRALAPETLGSFVLAFAAIELLRLLVRAGWREAVLLDLTGEATPTILAVALAAGLAAQPVALAAALAAPHLSATPGLAPALALLGLSVLPLGAAAVWEGTLLRDGAPDRAARPLLAAEIVQSAAAALLLTLGWGILALAAARVLRAAVLAAGLAHASGACALAFDLGRARPLLPVSGHVTLASLAGLAGTSGADIVVGFVLGPAAVALYRIAARIAGAVAEVVTETTRVFAWSALAGRGPLSPDAVATLFDRAFVLTVPVFAGLALTAHPLVETVLGPTWGGAAPILAWLALARLLAVPVTLAAPVLASHGRTRALPRLAGLLAATGLVATLAAGRHGLTAVALAQVGTAGLGAAATLFLLRPIAPPARLLPAASTIAATAAMALALPLAATGPAPATLALQVATGAALWAGFLRLCRPDLAAELLRTAGAPTP
ncbi:MAG: oligosaccharide flippase family protein [Amaricoccus sp.]|uniref:oligosaccharide flippase family protein n=1 Tax=Amaricoccus sp. TaxID=1872485 RepID=UPI0039E55F73